MKWHLIIFHALYRPRRIRHHDYSRYSLLIDWIRPETHGSTDVYFKITALPFDEEQLQRIETHRNRVHLFQVGSVRPRTRSGRSRTARALLSNPNRSTKEYDRKWKYEEKSRVSPSSFTLSFTPHVHSRICVHTIATTGSSMEARVRRGALACRRASASAAWRARLPTSLARAPAEGARVDRGRAHADERARVRPGARLPTSARGCGRNARAPTRARARSSALARARPSPRACRRARAHASVDESARACRRARASAAWCARLPTRRAHASVDESSREHRRARADAAATHGCRRVRPALGARASTEGARVPTSPRGTRCSTRACRRRRASAGEGARDTAESARGTV